MTITYYMINKPPQLIFKKIKIKFLTGKNLLRFSKKKHEKY